jgi:hypothetical protein
MTRCFAPALLAVAACSNAADPGPDAPRADAVPVIPDASPPGAIVVNEVAAAGDPDDWFEVTNVGGSAVDLSGFFYVDLAGDLARARPLPQILLPPGEYHVQEVVNAVDGFQLASDEELWLYDAGGTLVDGVDWADGDSPAGGSYARIPDGVGDFQTTTPDTRGAAND